MNLNITLFETCLVCNDNVVMTVTMYDRKLKDFFLRVPRHIVKHEGPKALFKGLGPNLVGVAPSRAIYFCAYSQAKSFFNSVLNPDTAIVHILSASCAGMKHFVITFLLYFVLLRKLQVH